MDSVRLRLNACYIRINMILYPWHWGPQYHRMKLPLRQLSGSSSDADADTTSIRRRRR
eukprot:SAG22_NODE_22023_length_252_cov_0.666667_1_plen_57_part_10